jgi:hypothetical protein
LGIIIAIPTIVIKLISLVFSDWSNWVSIGYGLQIIFSLVILLSLIIVGMLSYYTIQALRKPEIIEEMYKYPGWSTVIGFSFCLPILFGFAFQGEFMFGDVITTSLFFIIGILFITSGIIMIQEVEGGKEQIQLE